jgi:hypothetical protein
VEAGTLVIGDSNGNFTARTPMSVDVSVPSLDGAKLTGTGVVSATGIRVATLALTLSGDGVLRVTGNATHLVVTLAGSGDAQLNHLVARDVRAVVSGSGRVLVTATTACRLRFLA